MYLWSAVEDGTLWEATLVTVRRLLIGYGLGILVGLPLGLLTASFKWSQDTIGVLALGLQTLPSFCWVPLALLWFGQTEAAMLFVVVMGTLWSLIIATDTGVRTIPPIYSRAARSRGSSGFHTWTHVILPAALPFLLSGMKQGLGVCVAIVDGCGNLRGDSDGVRSRAPITLWTRAECDGSSDRCHAGDHHDRAGSGQDTLRSG